MRTDTPAAEDAPVTAGGDEANSVLYSIADTLGDSMCTVMLYEQKTGVPHYHDFEELVCVLDGHATHRCDGHVYQIYAGDIFLIHAGSTHSYLNRENLRIANILYRRELLDAERQCLEEIPGYRAFFKIEPFVRGKTGAKNMLNIAGRGLSEIRIIITKLERECREKSPGSELLVRIYFYELIALLSRFCNNDTTNYSRRMVTLSRMTEFIDRHYAENISRKDILRAGYVSSSTGSRLFKNLLQKSIIDYLLEVRIAHARRLIADTDLPITEIAYRCGFSDSNYFSVCFRKFNNCPPQVYRRKITAT